MIDAVLFHFPSYRPELVRVFVAGATGFLGGAIVRRLLAGRAEVVGPPRVDFDEPARWRDQLEGVDAFVHAATVVPAWGGYRGLRALAARRHRRLVLELVRARVPRLVLISSAWIYGRRRTGVITEDEPQVATGDLCGDIHCDAERIAREAHAAGLLELVVLRPTTCYGAGDRTFLPRLAGDLVAGRVALVGGGRTPASLCHSEHVAEVAWLAATHRSAPGHTFHVADSGFLTWRELYERVAAALAVPPPSRRVPVIAAELAARACETAAELARSGAPALSRHVVELLTARAVLSLERAARVLGWRPAHDTATGLARTLAPGAHEPIT